MSFKNRFVKRSDLLLMHEINVTPFVDVMLVLLVIFMITAPLMTQGLKVDLPQENSDVLKDSSRIIESLISRFESC